MMKPELMPGSIMYSSVTRFFFDITVTLAWPPQRLAKLVLATVLLAVKVKNYSLCTAIYRVPTFRTHKIPWCFQDFFSRLSAKLQIFFHYFKVTAKFDWIKVYKFERICWNKNWSYSCRRSGFPVHRLTRWMWYHWTESWSQPVN